MFPANLLEVQIPRDAVEIHHPIENQENPRSPGILVFVSHEFAIDARRDAKLFLKLADHGGFGSFAGLDFSSRKFPLQGMIAEILALRDQNPSGALDNGRDYGGHET